MVYASYSESYVLNASALTFQGVRRTGEAHDFERI